MSSKKSKNKSNDNNKNAFVRDIDEDNRKKNYNNKGGNVNSLSTLDYIQATVQKDVQEGLLALARMKPDNPIEFLGKYLYEKSKKKK